MTAPTRPGEPPSTASRSRVSNRTAFGLIAVVAVIVVAVALLVAQLAHQDKPSLAQWVVVPQAALHGPKVTTRTPAATSATIGDNMVTVAVPPGWAVDGGNNKLWADLTIDGYEFYMEVDPNETHSASDVVDGILTSWVKNEKALTDVSSEPVVPYTETSPLTGGARIVYSAKTVDGGVQELGNLFAFVRNDGWVLKLQLVADGSDVATAGKNLTQNTALAGLLTAAFNSFAGR